MSLLKSLTDAVLKGGGQGRNQFDGGVPLPNQVTRHEIQKELTPDRRVRIRRNRADKANQAPRFRKPVDHDPAKLRVRMLQGLFQRGVRHRVEIDQQPGGGQLHDVFVRVQRAQQQRNGVRALTGRLGNQPVAGGQDGIIGSIGGGGQGPGRAERQSQPDDASAQAPASDPFKRLHGFRSHGESIAKPVHQCKTQSAKTCQCKKMA